MKQDVVFSSVVHVVIILSALISSPFDYRKKSMFDDVIKVSLSALPEIDKQDPIMVPQPKTPDAMTEDEPVELPVNKPEKMPAVKVPEKKEEKSKTETKPKQNQLADTPEQKQVTAPSSDANSPISGATVDNPSFDYPYWFTQAFYKIRTNWKNPVSADGPITCTVYFQVIRSGRVLEIKIVESSGISSFDRACVGAIERSAPFPPLPKEFVDEILGITIPFQYRP